MGFGGSAGAMNIVLKNNRNMLKKKRRALKEIYKPTFKKSLGAVEYDLPNVHPKTIQAIGEKVRRENQEIFMKRLILFSIIMLTIIATFIYYK